MYTIAKQFHFSASHQLTTVTSSHPCSRLHGHNYVVELILESEILNEHGFIVDYLELNEFKAFVDEHFDHRHLNDVVDFSTTAENLAKHFYDWAHERWPQVCAVRVSETPKTWAQFRP